MRNLINKIILFGLLICTLIVTVLYICNNTVAEYISPTVAPVLTVPFSNRIETNGNEYTIKVECSDNKVSFKELLKLDDSYEVIILDEDINSDDLIDISSVNTLKYNFILKRDIYYLNRLNEVKQGTAYSLESVLYVEVIDTTNPVIIKADDPVTIIKGMAFKLSNYVSAIDFGDGEVEVVSDILPDTNTAGTYTLNLSATDSQGNTSYDTLEVIVKKKYIMSTPYYDGGTITSEAATTPLAQAIVDNAALYLGRSGLSCDQVVSYALNKAGLTTDYFQGTIVEDPLPGDIIFYSVNSKGTSIHVAVYVGDGMAIHGGWKAGQNVVIAGAVLEGAADPVYYRLWE